MSRMALGMVAALAALAQTSSRYPAASAGQDFCSSAAACYTPARGAQCPTVRFGWGNCPGSRQACDWCYGPSGVFAYSPRGSQYTLNSGCNNLGANATWATKDPQVAQWMTTAGGNCTSDGRGGYTCSNVDATRFKQAANCGGPGGSPPSQPQPQPAPSNGPGNALCSCYTPARSKQCPQVRFGWGDCPGSRQACDWCYGPNGVFAYSPRGSQYTLNSGCYNLGANATWATRDPQVMQAMTNAGGNCSSDGRGGYTCTNVDAARYQQAANCGGPGCAVLPGPPGATPPGTTVPADPIAGTLPPTAGIFDAGGSNCQKIQFTYFYINGINTAMGPDSPPQPGQWRGNYQSEHDTVALNLVDDLSVRQTNPQIPRAGGKLQSIKVANEIDTMYGATHNPSGTDPWAGTQWIADNCPGKNVVYNMPLCLLVQSISQFRAGNFTGHMAPGDLFECVRQSINLPGVPGVDLQATAQDATVQQVVNAIVGMYQQEQSSQTKNYFIVVGHSQGNFFVEGVAYALAYNNPGGVGEQIFRDRLGVVSLASPTSYDSLPGTFRTTKIVHHTRADDAINIVGTVGTALGWFGISGKKPWPPNDPMLWPWPSSNGFDWSFGLASPSGTAPSYLFGWDQLNCNLKGLTCDPLKGMFCKRLSYDSGVSPNPELYSPLMNSHLLDNYLDSPAATQSGKTLKWNPSLVPWKVSPRTTSVLNCIRHDLQQLKINLMKGNNNPVTSNCTNLGN